VGLGPVRPLPAGVVGFPNTSEATVNKLLTCARFSAFYVGMAFFPVIVIMSINVWIDPGMPWAKNWGPRCDLAFACWAALSAYAAYRLNTTDNH